MKARSSNHSVAQALREMADLLREQQANPFRVQAYQRAAATVDTLEEDVTALDARGGRAALEALPCIGRGIAGAIHELIATGRWSQLERLRGELNPEAVFATIPGIGPALAKAAHETLHVDTLEALEAAAHDGRLESVPGFGPRRADLVRAVLRERLGRARYLRERPDGPSVADAGAPSVAALLDADREYREKAARGMLRTITPRRFNPAGEAWLPVLHTERDGWHMTLLFSNTARAHELGRTRDWVVAYYYDGDHREGQCTVVTEHRGPLAGQRVVRGREREQHEPGPAAAASLGPSSPPDASPRDASPRDR